jgi:hypothetical protein
MLTEQHRLLIAAHVDGGLSPERPQAVTRLLEQSAEARDLFGNLQADGRRIRNLPRQVLPADFANRVLGRLPSANGQVVARIAAPRPDSTRIILRRVLSAAAVVFIAVGIGVYWVFTNGPEAPRPGPEVAERPPAPVAPPVAAVVDPTPAVEPAAPPVVEQRADNVAPQPSTPTPKSEAPAIVAAPTPPTDVLTAPARTPVHVEIVSPARVSLPIALRSLVYTEPFFRLREELAKDPAHRVEIFCRDPSRVADRLTAGCRDLGVKLVVDASTQQVQKQRLRMPYLMFCDSFTADGWAVFFHNLGYSDRRAEEKKPGDGLFDQLVITPLIPGTDQKELLNHIGTDVLAPVNRNGGSDKSEDGKTKPKPIVRQALLIPYQPQRVSAFGSKEIKQYLDARQERRDGQIAVMIVIKPL